LVDYIYIWWPELVYGFYLGAVIISWYLAVLLPGPVRTVWVTMTFKERMASLLASMIIFITPADVLYGLALTLQVR